MLDKRHENYFKWGTLWIFANFFVTCLKGLVPVLFALHPFRLKGKKSFRGEWINLNHHRYSSHTWQEFYFYSALFEWITWNSNFEYSSSVVMSVSLSVSLVHLVQSSLILRMENLPSSIEFEIFFDCIKFPMNFFRDSCRLRSNQLFQVPFGAFNFSFVWTVLLSLPPRSLEDSGWPIEI